MENKHEDNKDEDKDVIYIASSLSRNENEPEKIISGSTDGDRRHRVEPYKDERAIMKCIGRIESNYGDKDKDKNPLIERGTGTVYHVQDDIAYVITCAHNVTKPDDDDNPKYPLSVKFTREVSKYQEPHKYDAEIIAVHNKYMVKIPDAGLAKIEDNDLAIIKIRDDGFYQKIFAENSDIVHLFCSDDIDEELRAKIDGFHLYGYPCPHAENSKAVDGELWGMMAEAKSFCEDDDGCKENDIYVKKNKIGTKFIYNAIDTEGGQSGSPLFIEISDGKFGIVGHHTSGGADRGFGVALNKNKIEWIQDHIHDMPIKFKIWMNHVESKSPTRIPLKIHSHYGSQWSPENLLRPSEDTYYWSAAWKVVDDWIIFIPQNKDKRYYPKQIKLRNYPKEYGVKDLIFYALGSTSNDWIKCGEFRASAKYGEQTFDLHPIDIQLLNEKYSTFKLVIKNNHGSKLCICFFSFEILGVELQ